jgi:hypothetical protein
MLCVLLLPRNPKAKRYGRDMERVIYYQVLTSPLSGSYVPYTPTRYSRNWGSFFGGEVGIEVIKLKKSTQHELECKAIRAMEMGPFLL